MMLSYLFLRMAEGALFDFLANVPTRSFLLSAQRKLQVDGSPIKPMYTAPPQKKGKSNTQKRRISETTKPETEANCFKKDRQQDLQSYSLLSENGRMKVSARRPLHTGDATDLTLTLDKTYYVLLVVAFQIYDGPILFVLLRN